MTRHDDQYGDDLFAKDDYFKFGSNGSISGNLLGNDRSGDEGEMALRFFGGVRVGEKKGPPVTDVQGTYGTFHIWADGRFTYDLDAGVKASTPQGTVLTESIPYKISDKAGKTDFAYLTMDVGFGNVGSQTREVVYDFDHRPSLDVIHFNTVYDGDTMMIGSESGNRYWQADPWGLGFSSDHNVDFIVSDMIVATGDSPDAVARVTFTGHNDGRIVGQKTVLIDVASISGQQHVSLSSFGKIDSLTYTVEDVYGTFQGLPSLSFDDIHLLI
ncbi:VCBS domain-containing protein [Sphingomonas sanguinis]|uniref:Ig-like domain-containing protein n=1 Tax=Sphingomonas sp. LC-1 TaxID=3110957 RepID=UPI0021BAAB44|nr:VCBS domain-containing protein [Sphingomonas sp. LC-1]MCT8002476.1 VCBS domain-containing protein [Sphingomonas sp. LC-1]